MIFFSCAVQGRPTHLRSKAEATSDYLAANPETAREQGYTKIGHFEDQCLVVWTHDSRLNTCSKIPQQTSESDNKTW